MSIRFYGKNMGYVWENLEQFSDLTSEEIEDFVNSINGSIYQQVMAITYDNVTDMEEVAFIRPIEMKHYRRKKAKK